MKINLTVRAKNPLFWVQIALAIVTPILAYFGLTAADITSWPALGSLIVQAVSNPYVLCLAAVSVWNALQDPTTPGLSDSINSQQQARPRPFGKPETAGSFFHWKKERKRKGPGQDGQGGGYVGYKAGRSASFRRSSRRAVSSSTKFVQPARHNSTAASRSVRRPARTSPRSESRMFFMGSIK